MPWKQEVRDVSREVCVVLLNTSLVLVLNYGVVCLAQLVIGIILRLRSSDRSQVPRRFRNLWFLVTDLTAPTAYLAFLSVALYGILYGSQKWIIFSAVALPMMALADVVYALRESSELRSTIGFLCYSLACCHAIACVLLAIAHVTHLVLLFMTKDEGLFHDEFAVPPSTGSID